jgi:hypothetical protein
MERANAPMTGGLAGARVVRSTAESKDVVIVVVLIRPSRSVVRRQRAPYAAMSMFRSRVGSLAEGGIGRRGKESDAGGRRPRLFTLDLVSARAVPWSTANPNSNERARTLSIAFANYKTGLHMDTQDVCCSHS